ncbi:MAG TPA: type II toxin-antitoxin system PemK/MazF family toxin [Bdellovibrionota bacterium]|nr:type II toxin-antitoxin system PemK/MazF family toxin [Bdellovibrionota bacterium]
MSDVLPARGEVWVVDLNPIRGHEQAGLRPALILSDDTFNHGPADLVVVVPMTRTDRRIPLHVEVSPPEGGLKTRSFVMCEMLRSITKSRLRKRWGRLSEPKLAAVEERVRILLGL